MFFFIHNRNDIKVFKNHLLGNSCQTSLKSCHRRLGHYCLEHGRRLLIRHISHGHNPNHLVSLRQNRKTHQVRPFHQILKIPDCHFWSHVVVVFSSGIDLSYSLDICFDTDIRKCLVNHGCHGNLRNLRKGQLIKANLDFLFNSNCPTPRTCLNQPSIFSFFNCSIGSSIRNL